jgi:hypothetical protein
MFGTLADAADHRFFAVGRLAYNGPNATDTIIGLLDRAVTGIELQLNDGSSRPVSIVDGVAMAEYDSQKKVVGVLLITRRGRITCPTPADPKGWLVGFRC